MGLLSRLGIGGVDVDLVLDSPTTTPGGRLTGHLHLVGGKSDTAIEGVSVTLEALVEVERGDEEWKETVQFAQQPLTGALSLSAGEKVSYPVSLLVPWEAPITSFDGWHLRGMKIGTRTKVDIRGAVDPTDRDPVEIHPLPVQSAVLRALAGIGWRFHSADLEKGRMKGSSLPFYQEISFTPTRSSRIKELEVTFLVTESGVDIVLEADRRGGLLRSSGDVHARLSVGHHTTNEHELAAGLEEQITRLGDRRW